MSLLKRAWEAVCCLLSKLLAGVYERRAQDFEKSGPAAKRCELIATVPRGGSVLEIGAGTGATLASGAYAEGAGRFGRIVMSEPDAGMRSKLAQRVEKSSTSTKIEVADDALPQLPYPDASFDAVACFMVLSHVHKRKESLREISRVLRVGGRLLLLDHGAHKHKHGGDHGHNHGHSHDASDGDDSHHVDHSSQHRSGQFFWFKEWFSFVFWRRPKNAKIEVLLEDFYKEPSLREDFTSRMKITKGYFKELCFGSFTRVK